MSDNYPLKSLGTNKGDPEPIPRRPNGQFVPGWRPKTAFGIGRPPQSRKGQVGGRAAALQWIDSITKEADCAKAIKDALRKEAMTRPLRYFKDILMPLVPKEMLLRIGAEQGGMAWVSYLTSNLTEPSDSSPVIDISDSEPSAAVDGEEKRCLPERSCSTSED